MRSNSEDSKRSAIDELDPAPPWRVTGSKHAIDDQWLRVRVDRCVTEAGHEVSPYYVLEYPDWVHIALVDERGHILVTRQYRHARRRAYVELPGGAMESADASPLTAAQRELREETGYGGGQWHAAGQLAVNPATHTNLVHCFVVTDAQVVGPPQESATERLTWTFVDISTLNDLITAGEFGQALHVATMFLALRALKLST